MSNYIFHVSVDKQLTCNTSLSSKGTTKPMLNGEAGESFRDYYPGFDHMVDGFEDFCKASMGKLF